MLQITPPLIVVLACGSLRLIGLSEPSLQTAHSFVISLFPFKLSLPATFVPLAIGSSLSLRQAGKALHFVPLLSHLPSFGTRLLYLLGFLLRPRTAPDHPHLKTASEARRGMERSGSLCGRVAAARETLHGRQCGSIGKQMRVSKSGPGAPNC